MTEMTEMTEMTRGWNSCVSFSLPGLHVRVQDSDDEFETFLEDRVGTKYRSAHQLLVDHCQRVAQPSSRPGTCSSNHAMNSTTNHDMFETMEHSLGLDAVDTVRRRAHDWTRHPG